MTVGSLPRGGDAYRRLTAVRPLREPDVGAHDGAALIPAHLRN